jgi:hypothetical protein
MKPDDAIEPIAIFFNDLIGAIVPAGVLAIGLVAMHGGPALENKSESLSGAITFVCILGALFATGHVLLAIYELILIKLLSLVHLISKFDTKQAMDRTSYKLFHQMVQNNEKLKLKDNEGDWSFNDLRSVALTVSRAGESLGRRFMFLSLLCSGTATALLVITVDFLSCRVLAPRLLHSYAAALPWFVQVVLLLFAAWLLFKRAESFYSRAMVTPFAIAIAEAGFRHRSDG